VMQHMRLPQHRHGMLAAVKPIEEEIGHQCLDQHGEDDERYRAEPHGRCRAASLARTIPFSRGGASTNPALLSAAGGVFCGEVLSRKAKKPANMPTGRTKLVLLPTSSIYRGCGL